MNYSTYSDDKENSLTKNIIANKLAQTRSAQYRSEESASSQSQSLKSESSPTSSITSQEEDLDENSQVKRQRLIAEWQLDQTVLPTQHEILTQLKKTQINTTSKNTFYELPIDVGNFYKKLRNIPDLYDWQKECLSLDCLKVSKNGNLFYLSPTSGGKTLIAEIAILKCLLLRKKSAIFVMPFVSIVQEKVRAMEPLAEHFGFYCEEYAHVKGKLPPLKRRNKSSLYICTIEKANSLINSLIESDRFDKEIGLVVADEVHMIGDGPRGAIYELLLTKSKYKTMESTENSPIQIIATTATVENKAEIARFLNASLYERNFRPVELKEYIKIDKQILSVQKKECEEKSLKPDRTLDCSKIYTNDAIKSADPDYLVGLVLETVPDNSCLIFCSTKKNCENVATLLATHLPPHLAQHKRNLKLALYNELRAENNQQICPVLRKTIPFGIAYHHSGLTSEERQLIEQAYKDNILCIITCTSTLAAGVNLPAKRVIIRSPFVGTQFLSTNQYRQMIGRAGRAGLTSDNTGEAILIVNQKQTDKNKVLDLVTGPMVTCYSSLIADDAKAVRLFILTLIGLSLIKNGKNILDFFEQTLYFVQRQRLDSDFERKNLEIIVKTIDELVKSNLIEVKCLVPKLLHELVREEFLEICFSVTQLGSATIKASVDLDIVPKLYADLKNGLKHMVLSTNLHLLYLCTPYDIVASLTNIDYDIYARKFCNLSEDEIKCAEIIGVSEQYIQKKRFQRAINSKVDEMVVKRFYLTLIIYDLWKSNNSIWQVSNEFQLDRGFVQQIVQGAAAFSNGVMHFCQNLDEFWPYKNLLEEFCRRLQYNCISAELIPLMDLENVRLARAKQLFNAGFKNLEAIANADADDLVKAIQNMPFKAAKSIIKSAQKILKERAEVLQDEVASILNQINVNTAFEEELLQE